MSPSADHPWPVGALVRNRGDTTPFGSLRILGYEANGQVLTVSVTPPPWATRTERGVRSFFMITLQSCDPPTPAGQFVGRSGFASRS